ncbi:MAG: hypothetical protein ACJ746_30570 [Bryobacteraceae bacterium]
MPKNEVDSTILLLGVVAGAAALLLISSGQSWLCGAGGLALLLSLFAYDLEGVRSVLQSVAFSAVCALSFAAVIAPIAPYLFSLSGPTDPLLGQKFLPFVWLASTILFLVIDRVRMTGRVAVDRTLPSVRPSLRVATAPSPSFIPPQVPVTAAVKPVAPPPPPPRPPAVEPVLVREEPPPPPPPPPVTPAPAPTPIPVPSGKETSIYVNLTGEGLNLLRSVRAEHLGRDFYRIIDTMPADETWEYPPGAVVRCKKKNLSSGKALVAFEEAPRAQ